MGRIRKMKLPPITTVLGSETRVEGNLDFAGGMHLDGTVLGNITGLPETGSTLVVSHSGRVEGDVTVDNLILDGAVVGDVHARDRVELAAGARVTGTVHYRLLEMAMGAEVNGQLVHTEEVQVHSTSGEAGKVVATD